jgi:hypothetical protein
MSAGAFAPAVLAAILVAAVSVRRVVSPRRLIGRLIRVRSHVIGAGLLLLNGKRRCIVRRRIFVRRRMRQLAKHEPAHQQNRNRPASENGASHRRRLTSGHGCSQLLAAARADRRPAWMMD